MQTFTLKETLTLIRSYLHADFYLVCHFVFKNYLAQSGSFTVLVQTGFHSFCARVSLCARQLFCLRQIKFCCSLLCEVFGSSGAFFYCGFYQELSI